MSEGCAARPRTVAIKSIGCRTNQEEMVALQFRLQAEGTEIIDDITKADVVIVNTCAVTALTETKTRRLIQSISRDAPQAKILVTGCLAQKQPEELAKSAHWIVGNTHKDEIYSIITNQTGGVYVSSFDKETLEPVKPGPLISGTKSARTRFPIKIQEGCDFGCAYCIVPQLRGPSRSATFAQVVDTCRAAIDIGYKELVLTGTHIGQFRDNQSHIVSLLNEICAIIGDFRVRLSSLDPRDISDDLLELVCTHPKVCRHIHVSFQSLCKHVLFMMGRPSEILPSLIQNLLAFRTRFHHVGFGADFIVGFPGETDAMFQETCRNVEMFGFSYAHVFRYSKRPGTSAATMSDQISENVKSVRSDTLRAIIDKSRAKFIESMKGVSERIIVETNRPVRGVTSNYLHVEIPEVKGENNKWMSVILDGTILGRYCGASTPSERHYE